MAGSGVSGSGQPVEDGEDIAAAFVFLHSGLSRCRQDVGNWLIQRMFPLLLVVMMVVCCASVTGSRVATMTEKQVLSNGN